MKCKECIHLQEDTHLDAMKFTCGRSESGDKIAYMGHHDIQNFGCIFFNKEAKPRSQEPEILAFINSCKNTFGVHPDNKDAEGKFAFILESIFGGGLAEMDGKIYTLIQGDYYGINGKRISGDIESEMEKKEVDERGDN